LTNILQTLGARPSTFNVKSARSSLAAAIRGLISESKRKDLTEKLQTIQQRMQMAALVSIWEKAQVNGQTVLQTSQQQLGIMSKLEGVDETTKEISTYLKALASPFFGQSSSADTVLDELVHNIWSIKQPPHLSDRVESMDYRHEREVLASGLRFTSIQDREATIPSAYAKTFDWLFEANPGTGASSSWSSFPAWLEADTQEIYWIAGKAGAGKSTLMKFITAHDRLQQHLTVWSGPDCLMVASFYFWNAGTDLQKSHEGLMRTLLWELLRQRPDLVPRVCERRWACLQMLGTTSLPRMPNWQWDELIECFKALASGAATQHYRLAIFIDGLDEFEGDHTKLIEVIKDLSQDEGVKICVSSRPWNVFNDAFHQYPSLMIQDLTRNDIYRYVAGHLEALSAFLELQSAAPDEAARLLQDTASRADGVFLWVAVVVRALAERLSAGDKLADLHATLRQLPRDVENLFEAIRRRIDAQHTAHFAQYFLLFLESRRKPCILLISAEMFLLADENEGSSLHREFAEVTEAKRTWMAATMRRRLHSRTMGLLEIAPSGTVGFLHRTVLEWATRGQTLAQFKRDVPTDFNPNLELFKACATVILNFHPAPCTTTPSPKGSLCQDAMTDEKALRFWDLLTICLRHATLAARNHTTEDKTKLLRLLGKLEGYVDKLFTAEERLRKHPTLSEMLAGTYLAPDPTLAATQLRILPRNQRIFVHLAATFGIALFVVARGGGTALHDMEGLHHGYYSLLYAAVFGQMQFDWFHSKHVSGSSRRGAIPSIYKTRLELVKYLLQIAPHNSDKRSVMHGLINAAKEWQQEKGWQRPRETEFLDDVVALLRTERSVPVRMWRYFAKGPKTLTQAGKREALDGEDSGGICQVWKTSTRSRFRLGDGTFAGSVHLGV
jgi:energy-coupling factor transporter ATP-binding protein EcfA2